MSAEALLRDVERLRACEQCGRCSSACPLTGDDFNVRRLLRHVELGLVDELVATPAAWLCTTCGRCETACPNGIPVLEILRALRLRTPEEHRPDELPPCVRACPAGIDVPGYLRLIAQGDPAAAHQLILERVPFVGVLGRVCPHPCEAACRRGEVNEPIAVCSLKRYAADHRGEASEAAQAVAEPTGRRVAIVGAGPAGLAAAYHLRRKGHAVTLLEAAAAPGGMLRYGIPRYRLPQDVLEQDIRDILDLGVELRTGVRLGEDVELGELREREGFDAVFLATGLQQSKRLALDGADLAGVAWGVDFLRAVGEDSRPEVGRRPLVIGGGDVAMDVALTALRLGAEEVRLACLERRDEMPAHPHELRQALDEGVQLLTSWGPERIIGAEGHVVAIELVECTSVFDAEGRFCPAFGDERQRIDADQVILAIGQTSELAFAADDAVATDGELVVTNRETGETNQPGVFAGGEIATGAGSLIHALADARRVAGAIDRHLGGDGLFGAWARRATSDAYDGKRERGFADRERAPQPELPVTERTGSFREVVQGIDPDAVVAEAARCFQCDLERHPEVFVLELDAPG